ncbi:MAG: bifunctional glutamate N-acetyltransferase/amino-acid acetyltransferase ArgJ [bacterium]
MSKTGLSSVQGFKFAGIALENKKNNIGLLFSEQNDTYGVAMYTRSDIIASPVIVSKENDKLSQKKRAVLINSGNANAFTGKQGIQDSIKCLQVISKMLGINTSECYIGSTGVIGIELDMEKILAALPKVVEKLQSDENSALDFIKATMTTDTKIKQASVTFPLNGIPVTIGACVKGAGMIMPNMATMLSTVITDAKISYDMMKAMLEDVVNETFNCITIDGDTSPNDSVFFLSNRIANNKMITTKDNEYALFYKNLKDVLLTLAQEMIRDGEGATKYITINVINSPTFENAEQIAYSIGNSPLVKTALFGEQLNYGRILMAIGKARTGLKYDKLRLHLNNYLIVDKGEPCAKKETLEKVRNSLKGKEITITVDLNIGTKSKTIWTCDYSIDYIKINANYLS